MFNLIRRVVALHAEEQRLAKWRKIFPALDLEKNVQIKGNPEFLKLGGKVVIQTGTVLHLGGQEWCQKCGCIEIGEGSVISPYCVIYGCGPDGVHVGKNFDCGPYVGIFASRSDYKKGPGNHVFGPVTIGDNVIIFAHCVIGPGVTIGEGSTIAAGSVVTRDIPAHCLAAGNPAIVIKSDVR